MLGCFKITKKSYILLRRNLQRKLPVVGKPVQGASKYLFGSD